MKLLLEVNDEKATFIEELLDNFSFIKTKKLSNNNSKILEDIAEAVEEVNEIKQNKRNSVPLDKFLNEI